MFCFPQDVLMSMVHITTKGHGECPGSVLPPEAMLMFMWKSRSTLPLTIKSKKTSFAVALVTVGSQLRMRDTEGSCDTPPLPLHHPPKRICLDRKPLKRILKHCNKDAKL